MPDALRTATPMGDWRSFKPTCDVSAGWEGIATARAADALAARHPWLYLVQDTVAAILEDIDFGDEGVGIYHAEKIIVAKDVETADVFIIGQRVYWDPTTRLCKGAYSSLYYWIGIATEAADQADLTVEIDLKGDRAEVEAAI